jgi:antirestriction protein ArdC
VETGELDENDSPVTQQIPFLRYYRVFNLEQVDGIEWKHLLSFEEHNHTPIEECERIIENYSLKPEINYTGKQAYYDPKKDRVVLPLLSHFKSSEGHYSTLFHELIHSTGHVSRLNRKSLIAHNL